MPRTSLFTWIAIITCGVVGVVVVVGLLVAGSPGTERARKRDAQRVNDLSQMQSAISEYYRAKQKLPPNISSIYTSPLQGALPTDPTEGQYYTYQKQGENDYRLCATFEMEGTSRGYYGTDEWDHGVGTKCFDRHVDPDFLQPYWPATPEGLKPAVPIR